MGQIIETCFAYANRLVSLFVQVRRTARAAAPEAYDVNFRQKRRLRFFVGFVVRRAAAAPTLHSFYADVIFFFPTQLRRLQKPQSVFVIVPTNKPLNYTSIGTMDYLYFFFFLLNKHGA